MSQTYLVNGWVVSAPFDLGHHAPAGARPDVVVGIRPGALDPSAAQQPLAGRVIAHLGDQARYHELVMHDPDHATLRFGGVVDFAIDLSGHRSGAGPTVVEARVVDHADQSLIPLLVAGTLLSALLMLDGHMVLHASAVEVEGRTVAFVGTSGSGKSTLATMACLAGARLVSDDVLRVGVIDDVAVCHRGATHLRLRQGAVVLLDGSDHPEARTADGRRAFAPATPDQPVVQLDAVVLPLLCAPEAAIACTRLGTKQALFALLGAPRVSNWADPTTSAQHLASLLDLVERVPVYAVEIPWGIGAGDTTIVQVMAILWAADEPTVDTAPTTPP
jgi:hypothetical protein